MLPGEQGKGTQGMALLCLKHNDNIESIMHALENIGFTLSQASSHQEVMEKMKFHHYDFIILEEGFSGALEEDKVLTEIKEMSPSQRRKVFVSLLGDTWETGDEIMAFSHSVNLLINRKNLGEFNDIISTAMDNAQKSYRVFTEIKETLGKA